MSAKLSQTLPKSHPAAESFPLMDRKRLSSLKDDIQANGQLEPITMCDNMILDGRNRYRVCIELGLQPKTRLFDGNPWDYAWSLNGERRDLVDEQRYLIWKHCSKQSDGWEAERLRIQSEANAKRSENSKSQPRKADGTMATKPAPQHSVGATVNKGNKAQAAKSAASRTNPGAVARGDKLDKERPDLAEKVRKGAIRPAEAHRQMKKDQVAGKVAALPIDKFSVIYADPPWSYGDGRTGDRMTATGALHHYPTMSMEELKALDVQRLTAEDSVLFLWATSPLLPEGLELAKSWGFKYKGCFIWDKVKHNLGHYNSVRHEFLLICTRGSCTPEKTKLYDSVQSIQRTGKHSEKPEEFRSIIQTLYPSGKKIELFRRGKAPKGWVAWGNEHE